MRANRVNRREHQRRSGQDRRQQPDRRKNDKEIIAKQENKVSVDAKTSGSDVCQGC